MTAARPDRRRGPASALTTRTGRFVLPALAPGFYLLKYSDCTSTPRHYFDRWSGGAAALVGQARRVLVRPGETTAVRSVLRPVTTAALIRTSLIRPEASSGRNAAARTRAVNISGTVRNRAGHVLRGICVWVYPPRDYFAGIGIATSRQGTYSFAGIGLIPGRYLVMFTTGCGQRDNYAPQFWKRSPTVANATVLRLRSGQHARHIDARLGPGGSLSGTVRSKDGGKPLRGVCVFVTSVSQPELYQFRVVTKTDGSYLLTAMATGRYRIQFTPDCGNTGSFLGVKLEHPVRVTAGQRTSHVDASLPTAAKITGVVTDEHGMPVPGICIWEDGNFTAAVSGKEGRYAIRGLTAGRYLIGFVGGCGDRGSHAPQFYPGLSNPAQASFFAVAGGQVKSGVNARLLPGGTVRGTITNGDGQPLPGGCVLLAMPAALENPGGSFSFPYIPVATLDGFAQAARTGSYTIRDLPPGNYYAEFGPCDGTRYATQWFRSQPVIQSASLVSVPPGTVTTGVSAVLKHGGSISGVVQDRAGHPLGGICVAAQHLAGPDPFDDPQEVATRAGTYRITGLPPGRYAVQYRACTRPERYASQWFRAAASEASAKPVTVGVGRETSGIGVTLIRGVALSGRVLSAATGRPPRGFCFVYALDSAGNQVGLGTSTAKDGSYQFPHLRPGLYDLAACDFPGFGPHVVVKKGVRVAGRARNGVRITLPPRGSVAGHVGAVGSPALPGVCVTAVPVSGPGGPGLASTGLKGNYVIRDLARGTYQIYFSPVCAGEIAMVAPQWYPGQASQAAAALVKVTAGDRQTGIDAVLAADGGISGTATDALHGQAVTGLCVTAVGQAVLASDPRVMAVTGPDGSYQITGLTPGEYKVRFDVGCGSVGWLRQWYSGSSSAGAAAPVTVGSGVVSPGVDASLQRS